MEIIIGKAIDMRYNRVASNANSAKREVIPATTNMAAIDTK
jgi:hypothetical protein